MDIHVVFEIFPRKISKDDLYIVFEKKDVDTLRELGCKRVEYKEIMMEDPTQMYAFSTRKFFETLPSALAILENDVFSRMLQPIMLVVNFVLENIEKCKCRKIHLYGGSCNLFLAAENSEGESGGTWLYSRSEMMNPFIYRVLKSKCFIQWHNRECAILTKAKFLFRSKFLYFKVIAKSRLECIKRRTDFSINQSMGDGSLKCVLVPVWVKQQYGHLDNFFKKSTLYTPIFLSELSLDSDNLIRVTPLTKKEWNKTFRLCRSFLKEIKTTQLRVADNDVVIPARYIRRCLGRTFFQAQYHLARYRYVVNEIIKQITPCAVVNNKTWNWTQVIDKTISDDLGVNLHTLQYVMMPETVYPNISVFDKLYLSSRNLADKLRLIGIECYLYSGYPIYPVKHSINAKKQITVFLQPEMFDEVSLKLVDALVKKADCFDRLTKILIKPHYRQSKEVIEKIRSCIHGLEMFKLEEKGESATKMILQSDLVISFASSVLFEAVCYGVLPISMQFSPRIAELTTTIEVFSSGCIVLCNDVDSMLGIIKNIKYAIECFETNRDEYINHALGGEVNLDTIL